VLHGDAAAEDSETGRGETGMNNHPAMKRLVLIIEDNDANRYLARFILEKNGFEVAAAANGAEGVRIAGERTPDLVLMDIEMPEMDGYEAAGRLRAAPATAKVPIMAFTSYAHPADRERALAQGFSDYLEKPFDVDEFVRRVIRLLPPASSDPS
jgi:two-component system cell cycle response regulator DivK